MSGLGSLSPMPALGGAPGPKPEGLLGFLGDLMGGLHGADSNRRQADLEKAQVSEVQRQAAQQQLANITNIIKGDPTKAQDPKIIAQAKKLAAAAGLPDPVTKTDSVTGGDLTSPTDKGEGAGSSIDNSTKPGQRGWAQPEISGKYQGTDFGTPQIQRETLDMNVLAPKPDIHQIPEADQQKIFSLPPGPVRDRALESYGGVTTLDRQAPAIVAPAEKTQIYKQLNEITTNIGKGIYNGATGAAQLSAFAKQAQAAGIDTDELANFIMQDAATGPMTQTKIAQFNAVVSDTKAQEAYRKMLTVDKPKWMIEQLKQGQQKADAATSNASSNVIRANAAQTSANAAVTRADAANSRAITDASTAVINANAHADQAAAALQQAQNARDRNDLNVARSSVTRLGTISAQLNSEYRNINEQIKTIVTNLGDPSDGGDNSLMSQAAALKAKIDKVTDTLTSTKDFVQHAPTKSTQNATGNQTVQIGQNPYKPGAQVPGQPGYRFTGQKSPKGLWIVIGKDGQQMGWSPQ